MKKLHTLTLLALTATLGGCMGGGSPGSNNRSLDSVHQPIVSNQIFNFDVATLGGELPPSEQGRLDGWFDAMGIAYGDRIAVEDPSLYGKGAATAQIRRMVERRGLMISEAVPVTAGAVAPGYLRVTITRASARVPGCPDWARRNSSSDVNATSSNYGCAINSNLAAMVADPNDLIKGSRNETPDPSAATKPVRSFRDRKPTGDGDLKDVSTSGDGGGK
jgi:pilus assembly protein CpaD